MWAPPAGCGVWGWVNRQRFRGRLHIRMMSTRCCTSRSRKFQAPRDQGSLRNRSAARSDSNMQCGLSLSENDPDLKWTKRDGTPVAHTLLVHLMESRQLLPIQRRVTRRALCTILSPQKSWSVWTSQLRPAAWDTRILTRSSHRSPRCGCPSAHSMREIPLTVQSGHTRKPLASSHEYFRWCSR